MAPSTPTRLTTTRRNSGEFVEDSRAVVQLLRKLKELGTTLELGQTQDTATHYEIPLNLYVDAKNYSQVTRGIQSIGGEVRVSDTDNRIWCRLGKSSRYPVYLTGLWHAAYGLLALLVSTRWWTCEQMAMQTFQFLVLLAAGAVPSPAAAPATTTSAEGATRTF